MPDASEIEEDLGLDYKLICQIMDELKREGRLRCIDGMLLCQKIPSWLQNQDRRPGRLAMALFGMSTKECGRNTHNGKAISWIM
jgi:hypothetical protein